MYKFVSILTMVFVLTGCDECSSSKASTPKPPKLFEYSYTSNDVDVMVDRETGCEYLVDQMSADAPRMARLGSDGKPMCKPENITVKNGGKVETKPLEVVDKEKDYNWE